jgi:hypothetical protein
LLAPAGALQAGASAALALRSNMSRQELRRIVADLIG